MTTKTLLRLLKTKIQGSDKMDKQHADKVKSTKALRDYIECNVHPYNEGRYNPYHNNYQMLQVLDCAMALIFRTVRSDSKLKPLVLGESEYKILTLACMFHDFDHSGGVYSDDFNVSNAVKALGVYGVDLKQNGLVSKREIEQAAKLIYGTRYPYLTEPENDLERVLRDAITLWPLIIGSTKVIIEGLRAERQITHKYHIDLQQMYKEYSEYLNAYKPNTESGTRYLFEYKDEHLTLMQINTDPNKREYDEALNALFRKMGTECEVFIESVFQKLEVKVPTMVDYIFDITTSGKANVSDTKSICVEFYNEEGKLIRACNHPGFYLTLDDIKELLG